MIKVQNLSKKYGSIIAIDDISFQVEKGEILGFLGPNGAGKTTTMRILTGYMPPDTGSIEISGIDMMESPLNAKNEIGYLPEHPPVYNDMTVEGFLNFVAGLKGVEEDKEKAIGNSMERCGIADVKNRLIGNLSKGYRQRIGIAQAILNDPSVLVLDEPTIGLDPKQIIEIRELIKELGKQRTVILSTHILPEVMMTCTKVVIINKGKIALETSLGDLSIRLDEDNEITVRTRNTTTDISGELQSLPYITSVKKLTQGEYLVKGQNGENVTDRLAQAIIEKGWGLKEIKTQSNSLEDLFLKVISSETER
jgi:ABC-2 type transport system ATP-binding protein